MDVYTLAGSWIDGSPAVIDFKKEVLPVVLYVFSPSCHWCERNRANLQAIVAASRGRHRFIGVSMRRAGTAEYLRQEALDFPVLLDLSEESAQRWKFNATPQTIVVGPGGRLIHNWVGAYAENEWDVSAYFRTKLPGLLPEEEPFAHADRVQ